MESGQSASQSTHPLLSTSDRLKLGKLAFDPLTMDEALSRVIAVARERRAAYVVTPNVDHVVRAETDSDFVAICHAADLVVADGMPLVWASRLFSRPLPMRVAGSDLAPLVCAEAARQGMSVFLLGGMPGEAEKAGVHLKTKYPGFQLSGTYSPPFGFEHDMAECQRIIGMLNAARADIVLVGVGSPKQEKWIYQWRRQIDCGVLLGIGATIGFMAGTVKRAPALMQRTGLEWVHRLSQEPRRLMGRYARDLRFFPIIAQCLWEARLSRRL